MIFMKILKKIRGKDPELVELDKDDVLSIFYSGMDRKKIFRRYYLVDKYQLEKNEKTFNTRVIFPHTNMAEYYNDVYIIKKGIVGVKTINDKEFTKLIRLFKYDYISVKKPSSKEKVAFSGKLVSDN